MISSDEYSKGGMGGGGTVQFTSPANGIPANGILETKSGKNVQQVTANFWEICHFFLKAKCE